MKKEIKKLLKKDYEDLTEEEIEILENRLEELGKQLDYINRRDEVCCVIGGDEERDEVEEEIEKIQDILY
mgnify:CR=1 FL=1